VLRHMMKHNLAFFGAPYHPIYINKYRYFPCGVCLFVDLQKIPPADLDWLPEPPKTTFHTTDVRRDCSILQLAMRSLLHNRCSILSSSGDTGIRIYNKYNSRHDIQYETVAPVFKSGELNLSLRARVLDKIMPERYSYIPKRRHYYTHQGFAECGYLNLRGQSCEEYMWHEAPFAFHVRGTFNPLKQNVDQLTHVVRSFL
jgi:hypothetical protein